MHTSSLLTVLASVLLLLAAPLAVNAQCPASNAPVNINFANMFGPNGISGLSAGTTVGQSNSPACRLTSLPTHLEQPTFAADTTLGKARAQIASLLPDVNHDDGSWGPLFVRLAWHSSGPFSIFDLKGGSNGALMRFEPQMSWGANAGIKPARDRLEAVKAAHPTLSYADLYTLAGKVAVEEAGGPTIPWWPGRTDANDGTSSPPDGRLPNADLSHDHLRAIFYRMGFNDREIVALTGAHGMGRFHMENSGYDGPWTFSPTRFTNAFFTVLVGGPWTLKPPSPGVKPAFTDRTGSLTMAPADMALLNDAAFRAVVDDYARDEQMFFRDFADALGRLFEMGVPRS